MTWDISKSLNNDNTIIHVSLTSIPNGSKDWLILLFITRLSIIPAFNDYVDTVSRVFYSNDLLLSTQICSISTMRLGLIMA